MAAKTALRETIGREPDGWEIASAASAGAVDGRYPTLAAMLDAYGQIDDAAQEGNLSPAVRLADQIYRLSGRLCFYGCLACLHGDSDMMPSALAEVAVSRGRSEEHTSELQSLMGNSYAVFCLKQK